MTATQLIGATALLAMGIVIGYFIRKSDEKYDRANDPLPSLQEEVLAAHAERKAQDTTNRRAIRRANAAWERKGGREAEAQLFERLRTLDPKRRVM